METLESLETLTMQQIADLACVQRPVVSVWRRRFADSDEPFPSPVDSTALVFNAGEVSRWLEETGRGNNREARADAALFSSLLGRAAARMDDASALLLLHSLAGEALSTSDHDALLMLLAENRVESVLPLADAATALEDTSFVATIDALAEAGVTAHRVLIRLVRQQEAKDAPLGPEALTARGDALAGSVLRALAEDSERVLAPWGPGGLRLLVSAMEDVPESWRPRLATPDALTEPVDRLLWRFLVARGIRLETPTDSAHLLVVGQWATVRTEQAEEFFDTVDHTVLGLGPGSAALLLAPAPLLVDKQAYPDHRRRILGGGTHGYSAPLRYVARLPAGLCRFGGRRRLAMWVLGHEAAPSGRSFTTYGEHSAHALSPAENRSLGIDAAAALRGGASRRDHAFLRSEHRLTEVMLARPALAVPVTTEVVEDGGDALARLWEWRGTAASDVLDGIDVEAAGSASDHSLSWKVATTGEHRPARMITGVRIPAEVFAVSSGGIGVIGPEEVSRRVPVGSRSVPLVALVEGAPRFRLTEPGDVVFTASSPRGTATETATTTTTTTTRGPAAIIDATGGNVVQAPARILRCLEPEQGARRILPELAVRDIADARGSDCRSWRLRTVVVGAVEPWRTVAARAAERREQLLAELRALDGLTTELSDGLAAGTLRATHQSIPDSHPGNTDSTTTKENA